MTSNADDCSERVGQGGLTTREQHGYNPLPTDTIVMNELQINGSSGLPPAMYDEMFRMVGNDKLDPGAVVTDPIGLDDVNDELEAMTDYQTVGIPVIDQFA